MSTTGSTPLTNVAVTDDNGTPNNAPTTSRRPSIVDAATSNLQRQARPGRDLALPRDRAPPALGQYTNIGAVKATTTRARRSRRPTRRTTSAPTGIRIRKAVNARRSAAPDARRGREHRAGPDVPGRHARSIYTYLVYGDSALPLSNVVVRDDNATPGNPADDFNAIYVWRRRRTATVSSTRRGLALHLGRRDRHAARRSASARSRTPRRSRRRTAARSRRATSRTSPAAGPGSSIVKAVNALDPAHPTSFEDANTAPGAFLTIGSTVIFTYAVSVDGLVAGHRTCVVTDNSSPAIAPTTSQPNGQQRRRHRRRRPARPRRDLDLPGDGHGSGGPAHERRHGHRHRHRLGRDAHDDRSGELHRRDRPRVQIVKAINAVNPESPTAAEDANDSANPYLLQAGAPVVWTYMVTNLGDHRPDGVVVVDDNGTPERPERRHRADRADERRPEQRNGVPRQERDVDLHRARAHGRRRPVHEHRDRPRHDEAARPIYDNDPATYFGWVVEPRHPEGDERGRPEQPDAARGRQQRARPDPPVGTPVIWTYRVTQHREHRARRSPSPTTTAPRRTRPTTSRPTCYVSGDTNGDGMIDPSEIWLFTSAGVRSYAAWPGQYVNIATASRPSRPTARRAPTPTAATTSARRAIAASRRPSTRPTR